ncbi:carboxylesterase [Corallincola luteus]|uniref:Carboxylesterase n=1 Tax=Corallincola luteus TaxID=1775177 RepID=A0ABY2AIR4_9GAMM|nr:alpha/beta fold hydrolase [Corallincola luteus]TCI02630.1 carboxylesterase [Corallincola luteus]
MADSSLEPLDYIELNPKQEADGCVIWLHGLGDSGDGFAGVPPYLDLAENHRIRFIFPHAPVRPVTINNGMAMRAWYDIKSMDLEGRAPLDEVLVSCQQVTALIEQQIAKGIPSSRILLAGFSQGGVIALHLAVRYAQPLAGLVALSTYLCQPSLMAGQASPENRQLAIFFGHGTQDEVVPYAAGKAAVETLTANGFNVAFNTYPLAHTVDLNELKEIGGFIQKQLPPLNG